MIETNYIGHDLVRLWYLMFGEKSSFWKISFFKCKNFYLHEKIVFSQFTVAEGCELFKSCFSEKNRPNQ